MVVGGLEPRDDNDPQRPLQEQGRSRRSPGAAGDRYSREKFQGSKGDYILSTTEGEKPISGIAKYYQARLPTAILAKDGATITPFSSNAIRRGVATSIAEALGIGGEPLVARLLGHSQNSVTAIYNRYGYLKEMRAALEAGLANLRSGSVYGTPGFTLPDWLRRGCARSAR
jgi:integrase